MAIIRYCNDPPVRYFLDNSEIQIPLSHQLPLIRCTYPNYATNIGKVAKVVKAKYPGLCMLDIGANVGDTVAIVRAFAFFPILCIDGDSRFFALLRSNTRAWEAIDIVKVLIGDSSTAFAGSIRAAGGTAHLCQDDRSNESHEMKTISELLDIFPAYASAKLIKLDTDGFDTRILKSQYELLGDLKPVLFFEYDPYFFEQMNDDGFLIFEGLRNVGYEIALVFENTGEFVMLVELRNEKLLEDLHQYYSHRYGTKYCDICVFHADDVELAWMIRSEELVCSNNCRPAHGQA